MVASCTRVTSDELKLLAVIDPTRGTGFRYRHVYPSPPNRWMARVRHDGRRVDLGTAGTEREAAELVVRFFRRVYGADWHEAHTLAVREANRRRWMRG